MDFYILAGGQSRRLGTNKALLTLNGKTLIELVASSIPEGHSVKIIANTPEQYSKLGYPILPDLISGLGPIGGVLTGLTDSAGESSFFLACDLPFISRHLIEEILSRYRGQEVFGVRNQVGIQCLCAIYSETCIPVIEAQIGKKNYSLQGLCELVASEFFLFDGDMELFNVNTVENWLSIQRKSLDET